MYHEVLDVIYQQTCIIPSGSELQLPYITMKMHLYPSAWTLKFGDVL